jgi:hypothetical protein
MNGNQESGLNEPEQEQVATVSNFGLKHLLNKSLNKEYEAEVLQLPFAKEGLEEQ